MYCSEMHIPRHLNEFKGFVHAEVENLNLEPPF